MWRNPLCIADFDCGRRKCRRVAMIRRQHRERGACAPLGPCRAHDQTACLAIRVVICAQRRSGCGQGIGAKSDAMQPALVAALEVQARDDLLTRIAAFARRWLRRCLRRALIQSGNNFSSSAASRVTIPASISASAQRLRAARELSESIASAAAARSNNQRGVLPGRAMRVFCATVSMLLPVGSMSARSISDDCSIRQACNNPHPRPRAVAISRAIHNVRARRVKPHCGAAAQQQAQMLIVIAQQMKERAHAALCGQPCAPLLSMSIRERMHVAGKLRLGERDGVGTRNLDQLRRRQSDKHGSFTGFSFSVGAEANRYEFRIGQEPVEVRSMRYQVQVSHFAAGFRCGYNFANAR